MKVLSAQPRVLETPLDALGRQLTPLDSFFVRDHLVLSADRDDGLALEGLVDTPLRWSVRSLKRLPAKTITAVLQCAGNGRSLYTPPISGVQWQHGGLGQARWTGVPLRVLLARAGVKSTARHVHLFAADVPATAEGHAFTRSVPLERALHPSTLVAWAMNGESLREAHGAPLRLVVPGWAGDHWVKWLTRLVVAEQPFDGHYERVYRMPGGPVTVLPVKSVITAPLDGAQVKRRFDVEGIAFSGAAKIARVEVSLDGGVSWKRAALTGTGGPGRWVRFRARVAGKGSKIEVLARATDALGQVQPAQGEWNTQGYLWNGWHRVRCVVEPR
jgi:DMSO/TMAO reductase YedYZ molybdopterin-dependent catalytic subunit